MLPLFPTLPGLRRLPQNRSRLRAARFDLSHTCCRPITSLHSTVELVIFIYVTAHQHSKTISLVNVHDSCNIILAIDEL